VAREISQWTNRINSTGQSPEDGDYGWLLINMIFAPAEPMAGL